MSPRFVLWRENVPCVAEVVNRSLKADCTDFTDFTRHFLGVNPLGLNLNNPELTVFIAFKMTSIASENQEFVNSLIGNTNGKINAKHVTFYGTYSGLSLLISKADGGTCVTIVNDSSNLIPKPDIKFPSSKSNCTDLSKWHVISVMWSDKGENLSNCCEKLI